jgi:2-polyprenyl-6-methoxyphenol hydroxylase-like FAD-dependent oxidoreductase
LRIGVVGGATAGAAAALLLARDGHDVTVFERVPSPSAVGAGILLQGVGQRVIAALGPGPELERCSSPVRRVEARTKSGRVVLDFGYADAAPDAVGWGVHRGTLFDLLWRSLDAAGIDRETGVAVDGLRIERGRWVLDTTAGERGPFDLVIGADGAESRIRRLSGLATKDARYPYGAIWTIVPDPDGLAGDVLYQRYDGTRVTFGVLPTGAGQASIFWSVPSRQIAAVLAAGAAAWAATIHPYAGARAPLVERAATAGIMGARYRDVVARSPVRIDGTAGLVLLGDAAHAMSPQLGLGASLALADAWTLAACLRAQPRDLAAALSAHAEARRAHVRWYTWCSRFMTPVFQSDLVPIGWARDALFGPVGRIPWVRRQFVTTFMGIRTSPWTVWHEPR